MNNTLHLILGSMYSGKSSQLIRKLLCYKAVGRNIFCINSSKDTRTPRNEIMTHNGETIPACKTNTLKIEIPPDTHVIGIDEAQFFPDLVEFIKRSIPKYTLIVAGLDGDYKQKQFGDILKLIPLADSYEKIYAFCKICQDGTPGSFTKRIIPMAIIANVKYRVIYELALIAFF